MVQSSGAMGARRIYEDLRDQIAAGVYPPDAALPSSRLLAAELGVSRGTVTAAYERLAAEGFILVRQGARPRAAALGLAASPSAEAPRPPRPPRLSAYGARLARLPAPQTDPARALIADFRYGDLSPEDFPVHAWRRAMVAAMGEGARRMAYEDPRGSRRLRTALQAYLWRARGLRCDLDQILIVNGSQQGLDLCARLLLDAGESFAIENPCYAMAREVFAATGAAPIPVPVDREGARVELLAGRRARLAYVTPSHQYPLGGVLTIGRRRLLLDWARKVGAYVVEDDYDGEYRYDVAPAPPLHGLDESGSTIYLGTISKTLSPSLRLGYLVAPFELQDLFAKAKQVSDRHTTLVEQEALALLLESGLYERHVRRIRRRNAERRRILLQALRENFGENAEVEGAEAGLHLTLRLRGLPLAAEGALIARARASGVGVYPLGPLYDPDFPEDLPPEAGLVLGYASLDPRRIARGVALLAEAAARLRARF